MSNDEDDNGMRMVPVAGTDGIFIWSFYKNNKLSGAVFIATCVGGPAVLVAGLKLGMFAAIGGGIMGYTTGKMFADHEEKEAVFKEPPDKTGSKHSSSRKKNVLKRIEEYEKFEENCNNIKKLEKEKRSKMSKNIISIHNNLTESQRRESLKPILPEVVHNQNNVKLKSFNFRIVKV